MPSVQPPQPVWARERREEAMAESLPQGTLESRLRKAAHEIRRVSDEKATPLLQRIVVVDRDRAYKDG